jgi:benzoyl-CoA reductase/2-hydroxyglutaryl-CoA dehydratase subunit BcrC/BadD/HgdB
MELVDAIIQDRSQRARKLKASGRQILGYVCINPVLEMLTALNIVPFRIFGDINEPITLADTQIPHVVCSFIRSILDLRLKDRYDFLNGTVMGHNCDVGQNLASIWRTCDTDQGRDSFNYFLDFPHGINPSAQQHVKMLLADFKQSLEMFSGEKMTSAKLINATKIHNEQRALVRELYDLRKSNPPMISGTETFKIIVALMSLPAEEGNSLLRKTIREVKDREISIKNNPRLLIWGSILDNIDFVKMIEDCGANVVMDDMCVGSRAYWTDVELTNDPLDGLSYHYLLQIRCPRTYRSSDHKNIKKNYLDQLENRYSYLKKYVSDWNIKGVILQSLMYCDTHGYEVPSLRDYFNSFNIPSIYLEHNFSDSSPESMRVRIEAFLEMID